MRHAGGHHYWKLPHDVEGDAAFSQDQECRYWLTRTWPGRRLTPLCAFVGLNPSTADADGDDLTVRICWLRAREWGFGGFVMLNVFAYRDTSPDRMWAAGNVRADLVRDNDRHLNAWAKAANESVGHHRFGRGGVVIAAWGVAVVRHGSRAEQVVSILARHGPIYCLGTTETGHPRHPRGVRRDVEPSLWRAPFDEGNVTRTGTPSIALSVS